MNSWTYSVHFYTWFLFTFGVSLLVFSKFVLYQVVNDKLGWICKLIISFSPMQEEDEEPEEEEEEDEEDEDEEEESYNEKVVLRLV